MSFPKERPERGHDRPTHMAQDKPKNLGRWSETPAREAVAESYVQGILEIHAHIRFKVRDSRVAGEFCAAFYRPEDEVRPTLPLALRHKLGRYRKEAVGRKHYEMQKSVPVGPSKRAKHPEGVEKESIPSVIRLQSLDDCLCGGRGTPDLGRLFREKLVSFREYGEGEILLDLFGEQLREGEGVDEMVEGGPEIVEALAGDQAESSRGRLQEFDPNDLLAAMFLEIDGNEVGMGFDPSSDFGFQLMHVILCPL